ncbi:helix-turn-helix domain-containing protein [Brevibacterium casei]|uniref:helix-turn-helix domain-containing protein n=1 Tax=Brevibacterium casei TaxID=33889 RepID=UPI001D047F15|nr:helix-turn-helix domain-containing protein [Brevibacterium casei]
MTASQTKTSATMSVPEAGAELGLGRGTSYELAKLGQFPVRVLKIGSRYRVSRADLDRYLGITEDTDPRPAA